MITENAINIIKETRLSKNISQYKLAQITGINRSTIKRYEDLYIKNISFEHIIKMCKALEIDISTLLEAKTHS